MKRAIWVLIFNIIFAAVSYSQVNIIEVDAAKISPPPALPAKGVINQLIANPDLFAERIFQYYSLITTYDFIIKGSGQTHTVKIPELSFTVLSSPTKKIMNQFFNAADQLYKIASAIPPSSLNPKLNKMVDDYKSTVRNLIASEHQNDSLAIEQKKMDSYKTRADKLLKESIELRQQLEDKDYKIYNEFYKKQAKKVQPVLTIAPNVGIFQFHDDKVKAGISPGLRVELTPWRIFGFWFDYSTPKFSYSLPASPYMRQLGYGGGSDIDFRVHLYAVGAQLFSNNVLNLPFMGNSSLGLKLAYGYYWSYWKAYSVQSEQTETDFHTIRTELNVTKYDFFTPIEVFVAYNFYFGADKINLNTFFSSNKLSSTNWGAASVGLRFCLWKTP